MHITSTIYIYFHFHIFNIVTTRKSQTIKKRHPLKQTFENRQKSIRDTSTRHYILQENRGGKQTLRLHRLRFLGFGSSVIRKADGGACLEWGPRDASGGSPAKPAGKTPRVGLRPGGGEAKMGWALTSLRIHLMGLQPSRGTRPLRPPPPSFVPHI